MNYLGPTEIKNMIGSIGLRKKYSKVFYNLIIKVDVDNEENLIEGDDSIDFCSLIQDSSSDTKTGIKFTNLKDESTTIVQWKNKVVNKPADSKTEES